jgi:HD-like signal output (HDOD) protein
MTTSDRPTGSHAIAQELSQQSRQGPLRQIVIPPCPALLVKLRQTMSEPEPDLNAVAQIAASDVAMSATLLRNANGAAHAGGQPVSTVGQAMDRIGLDASVVLMTSFLVRHAIPVNHPRLRDFWDQAADAAATMHFIARQLPGLAPETAQLYGLFHHVGMPVLLQSVRGYGATLVEATARIDQTFVATENANHRTDHAVVGALVALAWHLPPTLVAAIRLHHDLTALRDDTLEPAVRTLVSAGLLADRMRCERQGKTADRDWTDHGDAALRWLGVSDDDLSEWQLQLDADLQPA